MVTKLNLLEAKENGRGKSARRRLDRKTKAPFLKSFGYCGRNRTTRSISLGSAKLKVDQRPLWVSHSSDLIFHSGHSPGVGKRVGLQKKGLKGNIKGTVQRSSMKQRKARKPEAVFNSQNVSLARDLFTHFADEKLNILFSFRKTIN